MAAGLSEREVAEFVEDSEVHPGQMLGNTTLPAVAGLDLQAVDEVDHVIVAAAAPDRMQLLAIAMAICVLPVPVPPTRTALRCWAMKPPPARSLTSVWLMGVPSGDEFRLVRRCPADTSQKRKNCA